MGILIFLLILFVAVTIAGTNSKPPVKVFYQIYHSDAHNRTSNFSVGCVAYSDYTFFSFRIHGENHHKIASDILYKFRNMPKERAIEFVLAWLYLNEHSEDKIEYCTDRERFIELLKQTYSNISEDNTEYNKMRVRHA